MLAGVLRYYETPYQRNVSEPPTIWQRGSARLLDYGQKVSSPKSVVLFIPSLINRYYILDLEEERSFLRYLATQGIYPLVLDWGKPSATEQKFNCGDYVTEILSPAIDFISKISAQPVALAGYCMGGVLALAAAKIKRTKISSLALFATPWDFHCPEFAPFVLEKKWQLEMAKRINEQKTLPAEMIQSLFYLTDPFVFEHKFRRYAELDPNSRVAKDFVALEHWVNDGVPMTSGVAHDSLIGWAQENKLAKGEWVVSGKNITPPPKTLPTFIAIPRNDHVVPFECAIPLATASKHAQVIHPSAGHVGMIVGGHAKRELWHPYATWLLN
jgi:polyhydroxyalkanoate synthase